VTPGQDGAVGRSGTDESGALLRAAKAAHSAGQTAAAEELYTRVIATGTAHAAEAHRCLGILCAQTNRLPRAIEHVRAALSINPDDALLSNDLGMLYQRANRLGDAITVYREVIARRPNFAATHLRLGSALHQQGTLEEAIESYRRALSVDPGLADAQLNLGVALQQLGRHGEAAAAFGAVLSIEPRSAGAHFNLGISLIAQDRVDEGIAAYRAALSLDPSVAAVHANLGMAHERRQELDAAIACYRRAIELEPRLAVAHNNLGCALRRQGRFGEATDAHREALRIDPSMMLAYVDLGSALEGLGQADEAILSYRRAIALDPGFAMAHRALAVALRDKGLLEEAFASFRRHASLVFGSPSPRTEPPPPYRTKHDREQLDYLVENRVLAAAAAIDSRSEPPQRLDECFSTPFLIERGERIATPAINLRDDRAALEARWDRSDPKIVVVDNLLSTEALDGLKRFCWGSTIWRSEYRGGYLGAMPESGFAVPLLAQISDELVAALPRIFRDHPLLQWWAFKYDSELSGIGVHADFAAVNVNFWITPDEANLDPEHGGLVIWDKPAPLDWTFDKYNSVETDEICEFLARSGAKSTTVPYRANRAVIFDSDLFHATDRIRFKGGYLNRRINVTLLYGLREQADGMARPKPRA
jgi:tetratricopeptide (TPR) repeat protein